MLSKLVLANVRRARRDYLVYLITLALGVMVFYAFNTVSMQVDIAGIEAEGMAELLGRMLAGLTVFLAALMAFLMVYANAYIMRRRKREFGLYQLFGMSRAQVGLVAAAETLIVCLLALALGLAAGVALSQLMVFFTASLFKTQVASFHFFLSPDALLLTLGCTALVFVLTLLLNLRVVGRSRVSDLMAAHRRGEQLRTRNPWLSLAIFVAGAIFIGIAYARLLHDGLPVNGMEDDFAGFGITTLIVVVGTILVFYGAAGALLKLAQAARALWWRGLNAFTARQLAAKVNSVSASCAIVAMVLFLAITSVTSGMSIAAVMSENLELHTPVDWSAVLYYWDAESVATSNARAETGYDGPLLVSPKTAPDLVELLAQHKAADGEQDSDLDSIAEKTVQLDTLSSYVDGSPLVTISQLAASAGVATPQGIEQAEMETGGLPIMRESTYNRYLSFIGQPEVSLGKSGYLITCDAGESLTTVYDAALAAGITIDLGGHVLTPVASSVDPQASSFANSSSASNTGTLIVPDAVVDALDLPLAASYLLVDYASGVSIDRADAALDLSEGSTEQHDADGNSIGYWGLYASRTAMYETANSMRGLISYLAIYIGFVLVVACAAILAIQQLSAVADAGPSCRVLAELGCETPEICHSFLAQQAVFFAGPLVLGLAHSLVALRVVISLVELFGQISLGATVGLTLAIFLACYGGYFAITYAMSKGIIREVVRVRHVE